MSKILCPHCGKTGEYQPATAGQAVTCAYCGKPIVTGAALESRAAVESAPTEIFKASRWTHGNRFFPTVIEISSKSVVRRNRTLFSHDEVSIAVSKVASVHIKTGLLWSDIIIESSGGSDPLTSHGHYKSDARRMKELLEQYQAAAE